MKTFETKLPAGDIVDMKRMADGTWVIKQQISDGKNVMPADSLFSLIDAESLSMDDEFMGYTPKTNIERNAKDLIRSTIRKGVKNFFIPVMAPSFTDDGENICFEIGREFARGMSYNWWKKIAEEYKPERNSRLGTLLEYGAFLGVLIKMLIEEGKTVDEAWKAVCGDSKELVYYYAISELDSTPTGSTYICGFYDINWLKILSGDPENGEVCYASDCDPSGFNSVALYGQDPFRELDGDICGGTGWIVLEK